MSYTLGKNERRQLLQQQKLLQAELQLWQWLQQLDEQVLPLPLSPPSPQQQQQPRLPRQQSHPRSRSMTSKQQQQPVE